MDDDVGALLRRMEPSYMVAMSAEQLASYVDVDGVRRMTPQQRSMVGALLVRRTNRQEQDAMTRATLRVIDSGKSNPIDKLMEMTKGAVALTAWVSAIEAAESTLAPLWCTPACEKPKGLAARVEHLAGHVAEVSPDVAAAARLVRDRIRLRHEIVHGGRQDEALATLSKIELGDLCKPMNDLREGLLLSSLSRIGVPEPRDALWRHRVSTIGITESEAHEIQTRALLTPPPNRGE